MRAKVANFRDFKLGVSNNNSEPQETKCFKQAMDKLYLEGFLNAGYTKSGDFNDSSPADSLKEAMGLNKQGKLNTKVIMYANKCPLENVFKLIEAVKNADIQNITENK